MSVLYLYTDAVPVWSVLYWSPWTDGSLAVWCFSEWFATIWGCVQVYLIVIEHLVVIYIGAKLLWTQKESIFSYFPCEFSNLSLLIDDISSLICSFLLMYGYLDQECYDRQAEMWEIRNKYRIMIEKPFWTWLPERLGRSRGNIYVKKFFRKNILKMWIRLNCWRFCCQCIAVMTQVC